MKLDDGLERVFRRLIGRPRREPTQNMGLVTRSVAMLIDGVILNGIFLLVAALLGFVVSAIGDPNGVSTAGLVFGLSSWVVFGSVYLLIFWSTAGQTPGMRLISIRIEDHDGSARLGFRSARRRLVGLILALIPFGLGLLGLLTRDDRRGLWDRRAGSDVIVDDRLAAYALSSGYYDAYYAKAQRVRTVIKREHDAAFEQFDVLVSPTSPTVAFELGAKTENPLAMYLNDLLTIPSCMAGLPGLSIPCGLSEGLPVGLQLIGPQFAENTLFRVGHALEGALGFDIVPERLR